MNAIRDELRGARARVVHVDLEEATVVSRDASPVEIAVGRDMMERYERALSLLPPDQAEAILLRIEMGFTYVQIADAVGRPTENAARQLILRGLVRLAKAMHEWT